MYMTHARGAMRRNSHAIEKKQNDTRGLLVRAPVSLPCVLLKELRVVGLFCTKTYLRGEVPFVAPRQWASLQRRAGIREHRNATTV